MQQYDLSCLYSTVRNTSGKPQIFSFLPPHGRPLAADEELTVFGDIREAMITFDRIEAQRTMQAFEAAIARGDLTIINTPAIIFSDPSKPDQRPQSLQLLNGVLGFSDACFYSDSSESSSANEIGI